MTALLALVTFAGLTVGNFGFEYFYQHRWATAYERSYFQGVALLAFWGLDWIRRWPS